MAIRKIARLGNPILRQKAEEIPHDQIHSPEIQRLIDDMIATMREYEGIGLAAPQVHESVRLFITGDIYDPEDESKFLAPERVVINPEIKFLTPEEVAYWEGCLCLPDLRGLVRRPRKVQVTAYDRQGKRIEFEAEGYPATVIQHEYDHLDGIVFLDRMANMKNLSFTKEFSRYLAPLAEKPNSRTDDQDTT